MQSEPRGARTPVWALPVPLAATPGITVVFSSSGYLDVSVHRVPLHRLCIHLWIHGVCPCGFPHSEIRGSPDICSSPRLFAAYHVFLRLSVPRHPPCALSCLTFFWFSCLSSLHSVAASFLFAFLLSFFVSAVKRAGLRPPFSLADPSDVFIVSLDLQYSVFKVQCPLRILTVLSVIKNQNIQIEYL